jgi:DNA-binding transcriptional MerR regulator
VQALFEKANMASRELAIGALADRTQCTVPTIRYYEEIGLLPHAERGANGHRYYREEDVRRLLFIKRCRDFGFPIEQVKLLAHLFEDGDRACVEVRDLAQVHLDQVRAKLKEMRQLEISLAAFVTGCNTACSEGATRNCVIIEDLSTVETGSAQAPSCCQPPTPAGRKRTAKARV